MTIVFDPKKIGNARTGNGFAELIAEVQKVLVDEQAEFAESKDTSTEYICWKRSRIATIKEFASSLVSLRDAVVL